MNEQNSTLPTLEEIGARWGVMYNQALAANIVQEKQLEAQAETIGQLTASEVVLVDHIQELEVELSDLKKSLESLMPERGCESESLSPEAQAIADRGTEIIRAAPRVDKDDSIQHSTPSVGV